MVWSATYPVVVPSAGYEGRAEGAGGVDAGAGVGNQQEVRHRHRQADQQRRQHVELFSWLSYTTER